MAKLKDFYAIGEKFEYEGEEYVTSVCEELDTCKGCAFEGNCVAPPGCEDIVRKDATSVIFVKVEEV